MAGVLGDDIDDFDIEAFDDDFGDDDGVPPPQGGGGTSGDQGAGGEGGAAGGSLGEALATQIDLSDAPPEVDVKAMYPNSTDLALPRISNTICWANMGKKVDLRKLACGACFVEYNPKRNNGAILRIRDPPCACIIRQNGTMTLSGAPNVGAAKRAAELAARIVRKVLQLKDLTEIVFRTKSLMVRFDLAHPIRLEELASKNGGFCTYESEVFCGCTVKLRGTAANRWRVTANVFVSGKVTMTGGRTANEIKWAYDTLLPILALHAKGAVPSAGIPAAVGTEGNTTAPATHGGASGGAAGGEAEGLSAVDDGVFVDGGENDFDLGE